MVVSGCVEVGAEEEVLSEEDNLSLILSTSLLMMTVMALARDGMSQLPMTLALLLTVL